MKTPMSGVILAGGRNKRFAGENKAFVRINGKRIIEHIYELFQELFDEIILVTNDPRLYLEWDSFIVTDHFPIRSSLTGIHAGLFAVTSPYAFFTACDMPFIKKEIVQLMIDSIDEKFDIILPHTKAGFEPLFAVYSKRCIKIIENSLKTGKLKIQQSFSQLKIKKISEDTLRGIDPDLNTFFNINTPEDLKKAQRISG